MEVVSVGRMRYEALIPCLIAGIVRNRACAALGIWHRVYQIAILFDIPVYRWYIPVIISVYR